MNKITRRGILAYGAIALVPLPLLSSVTTPYNTPEGDEPLEVFTADGWVEYPFDELAERAVFRQKRFPDIRYIVDGGQVTMKGVKALRVVRWEPVA